MEVTQLTKLQEQRNKLVHDMKELVNKPEFSEEDKSKFNDMEADESRLHDQINKMVAINEKLAEMDARQDVQQPSGLDAPLADHRNGGPVGGVIDQNRCFRAWALGKRAQKKDIEYARSVGYPLMGEVDFRATRGKTKSGCPVPAPRSFGDIESRAAVEMRADAPQSLVDAEGGFTVPDEMMRAIDVALLAFGGVRQAATVISTSTGAALPIPTTNDTTNKGAILAENTIVSGEDVVFGQIVLGSFKYTSNLILISYELMQDSATNLPALMGRLLGERIGRIQADHFTVGGGTTEPFGIVTGSADSGVTLASATAITWAEMLDLEHSVDPAYRGPGTGWMMADATFKQIKQIQDTQERPLWQPSLISGAPDMFDGFPIYINQSMPTGTSAKSILFGQLDKFLIRDVMGYTLVRLDERYADYAQVGFLAWARADSNMVDAGTNPVKYVTSAAA